MYGSWSATTFLGVALAVCAFVGLAIGFSPLLAVLIALPLGLVAIVAAALMRRQGRPGASDRIVGPESETPANRTRPRGEPASGEG
jgi:hypothetical protein